MNRKSLIGAVCGFALLAALGAGAYLAWQDGLIPSSVLKPHPRAPLSENFLATLKASPAVAEALRPACVRMNLYTNREVDRMGRPGLSHQRVPGWDVIVIAQVPSEGGQRISNMTQALEALAKGGIYSVTDTETDDGAGGKLPAKAYALTFAGWDSMVDDQCIKIGTPELTEISEFAQVIPDKDGKRIYEIKARYAVQKLAAWLEDPAVQSIVSAEQLKKVREPGSMSFRLLRTNDGWAVEAPERDTPALTKESVMALVAKWREGAAPEACIKLPAKGTPPGFDITLAPYAVTLFDAQGDLDARFLSHLMWQSRFGQLVKAGVFTDEKVAADPKLNAPAGIRFVLNPAYQPWLDMNDARCLRMGAVAIDFISVALQPRREAADQKYASATAKLVSRLAKDAWIEKVTLNLPEVAAVKEAGGVPVTARLVWTEREKDRQWRLASLQAPQSEPVPARMPRVPAPALVAAATPPPLVAAGAPVAASAPNGDVTWRYGGERSVNGRVSNSGLTVTYCCAGASSTTLASQSVTTGKVYAEFTLTARLRSVHGDTYTTIGMAPASLDKRGGGFVHVPPGTPTMAFQRGSDIAHNDVIGLAIDMDAGRLYFSRNGAWLNGQPGAGGGVPLTRGESYTVAAVLSASSATGSTDSWTANFGKTRFRYAIPRGFKSYDGRQRG